MICSFVSSQLSVEVISCFEVKPRRRRYETSVTDRKAFLPARRRPQGLVVIGVCLSVCLSVRTVLLLCLSARYMYLKNGFMDHHQIWWVGPGGEPVEEVQFWC